MGPGEPTTGSRPAPVLIRGGYIVTLDDEQTVIPHGDILIRGGRVEALGRSIAAPPDARIIDARGRLVMPGLINAHMHSDEILFRGLLDNMPLEVWMLYSLPPLGYGPIPPRLIYLRTLLGAIESLQSGTTAVQDDVSEAPRATREGTEAVLRAYLDAGIRASVACNMTDKPYHEKLPYVAAMLPGWAMEQIRAAPVHRAADLLALDETLLRDWHERDGRIRIALSASAPQRCSDEFLVALDDLSRRHRTPLLTHVLETKVQVTTGREFYGESIVEHLAGLSVLSDRLTLAHGIWLTGADIDRLGAGGAAVAHNPVSNLKLGSGLMPWHALRRAGVAICLGTDGPSSNDALDMFEVMKSAALLHKIASPVDSTWPSARDALRACLHGGARSLLLQDSVGRLAPGYQADLVLLRLDDPSFVPLHDPHKHLVYCASGRHVETVLVAGRVVVEGGRITTVNPSDIYAEVGAMMPDYMAMVERSYATSRRLEPIIRQMYERCQREASALNRFATPPADWAWP